MIVMLETPKITSPSKTVAELADLGSLGQASELTGQFSTDIDDLEGQPVIECERRENLHHHGALQNDIARNFKAIKRSKGGPGEFEGGHAATLET